VLSHNFSVTNHSVSTRRAIVTFTPGSATSSDFCVFRQRVSASPVIELSLSLRGLQLPVAGLICTWSHSDPAALAYLRSASLLMSGLLAYMAGVCAVFLRPDWERFSQLSALALGVAGIAASNPLGLVWEMPHRERLSQMLMDAYIAAFRVFCACQLEMVRAQKTRPGALPFCAAAAAFGAYAAAERCLGQVAMLTINLAFAIAAIAALAVAAAASSGWSPRRVAFFGGALVADAVATLAVRARSVANHRFAASIVPEMVRRALPMTAGAFALFLMQVDAGPLYQHVREGSTGGALAVDEMSNPGASSESLGEEDTRL
jgi:hypothetical protein